MSEIRAVARTVTGTVVSDAMDKSFTILIQRSMRHPVYGKYVKRSKKMHVHDADNAAKVGDLVVIEECRPVSKTKSWRLVKVLGSAQ